ncbi:MAG TPA: ATP-binding protein, partial [Bacteroidales bacterium]|nr:ATP-binding protein [Bacteroidales bacterium]
MFEFDEDPGYIDNKSETVDLAHLAQLTSPPMHASPHIRSPHCFGYAVVSPISTRRSRAMVRRQWTIGNRSSSKGRERTGEGKLAVFIDERILMKLDELMKQGESQRLEFKESFGKETVETVAAFSNASGGVILIGVDMKGKVNGIKYYEESIKDWANMIKQATLPQIFPEISPVLVENKWIVSVFVQEYPVKPVSCKGKYFKRIGASNHQIPV